MSVKTPQSHEARIHPEVCQHLTFESLVVVHKHETPEDLSPYIADIKVRCTSCKAFLAWNPIRFLVSQDFEQAYLSAEILPPAIEQAEQVFPKTHHESTDEVLLRHMLERVGATEGFPLLLLAFQLGLAPERCLPLYETKSFALQARETETLSQWNPLLLGIQAEAMLTKMVAHDWHILLYGTEEHGSVHAYHHAFAVDIAFHWIMDGHLHHGLQPSRGYAMVRTACTMMLWTLFHTQPDLLLSSFSRFTF